MSAVFRRCLFIVCALALSGVFGSSPALAGTTGSITGTVTDGKTHLPLAGVRVEIASPAQTSATVTDAGGRFTFISLAPDTYAITLGKTGYERLVAGGITVQADQELTEQLVLQPSLQQIGHVTARSPLDLVKPGTISDVYSVGTARHRGRGAARRRRRAQQRVLGDRVRAGRVRAARAARRQPERVHPRRLLRPDRLRVRRRADEPVVRQLSRALGRDAGPAGAASLHGRRRRGRVGDRSRGLHQSSRAHGDLSRLRRLLRAPRRADVRSRLAVRSRRRDAEPQLQLLRRRARLESRLPVLRQSRTAPG